jgi:hypothetical protein
MFALAAPALALFGTLVLSPREAAVAATALVVAGSVRELVRRPGAHRPPIDDVDALEHQLARWRRRGEAASLLVVEPSAGHQARRLVPSLRSTDAVALLSSLHGTRLVAALDEQGLDRPGLEGRLATLDSGRQRLGWASFPADGSTLEALLASATAALEHRAAPLRDQRERPVSPRHKERAALPAVELAERLSKLENVT